jgi:cellobiose transport system permease protein
MAPVNYYTDYSLVLTGASLAVPPVVAIFVLPARRIVGGQAGRAEGMT